jgi:ParB-like chromosome segregation protein Spo0J
MAEFMSIETVLAEYRDGDEHGWDTEFEYLETHHGERIAALRASIAEEGMREPVLLGSDGRVWDGHHRLCVANELGMKMIPVTRP